MELDLPRDWRHGVPANDDHDDMDFPEQLSMLTADLTAEMSTWGWDPTRPFDPHVDAPLSLAQAVCLPELGGELFLGVEVSIPSPVISIKTLRGAIERGELSVIRPNTKNLYVTRKLIREWLEATTCVKNSTTAQSSANVPHATTQTGSSPTAELSSSTTSTQNPDKLRQDALSAALRNMMPPKKRRS